MTGGNYCEPGSTSVIDHVALDCSGKADVLERVKALGMEFAERQGEGWSVIYTRDPHGLMLELYFAEWVGARSIGLYARARP